MTPETKKILIYAGLGIAALYVLNSVATEAENTVGSVGIFAGGAITGGAAAILIPLLFL